MNTFKEYRLWWIEMELLRHRRIHRRDVTNHLGISKPAATVDLREFRERYPESVSYDPGTREYVALKNYWPNAPYPKLATSLDYLRSRSR